MKYLVPLLILITGLIVANNMMNQRKLITHSQSDTFIFEEHAKRLKETPDLTLPLEEELSILEQLTQFELGRFLLENRGINGYWTAYWLIHGPKKNLDHPLEHWLIHKAPSFRASRERYKIFHDVMQKSLHSNMRLASIPCGLMDSLLDLNYDGLENIELDGYDLDQASLDLARENVTKYGKQIRVSLYRMDAWRLDVKDYYDLLTSNGLNFYEPDDKKVIDLYRKFYQALRKHGILVTSFLTPTPGQADSPWQNYNPEDARKQRAIFKDILNARWNATRTVEKTRQQLEEAGFKEIEFIYDSCHIFPTVIARKL